jgi:hypothetical protein
MSVMPMPTMKNCSYITAIRIKLNIPVTGTSYPSGKNDLFALVIALKYTLSKEDLKPFLTVNEDDCSL